jgi:hypothetical protein
MMKKKKSFSPFRCSVAYLFGSYILTLQFCVIGQGEEGASSFNAPFVAYGTPDVDARL